MPSHFEVVPLLNFLAVQQIAESWLVILSTPLILSQLPINQRPRPPVATAIVA